MYELWAARSCLFEDSTEPLVTLSGPTADSARQIGHWIAGTHIVHHELFAAFDECNNNLSAYIFLHGNHDSYLSVPEVVTAANDWIRRLPAQAWHSLPNIDSPETWERQFPPTTIYPRKKEHFGAAGIFFDHGQRGDKSNRDGETDGPNFTNMAVDVTSLKVLDSVRRETFVSAAASMYLMRPHGFRPLRNGTYTRTDAEDGLRLSPD